MPPRRSNERRPYCGRREKLMNELFGLSMSIIMYVLLAIFCVCIAAVAMIFLTNRVMFKMGLRNIPRRGLQTGLIVLGLMLATLIITAAFTTGDTVDHSVRCHCSYDLLLIEWSTVSPVVKAAVIIRVASIRPRTIT